MDLIENRWNESKNQELTSKDMTTILGKLSKKLILLIISLKNKLNGTTTSMIRKFYWVFSKKKILIIVIGKMFLHPKTCLMIFLHGPFQYHILKTLEDVSHISRFFEYIVWDFKRICLVLGGNQNQGIVSL